METTTAGEEIVTEAPSSEIVTDAPVVETPTESPVDSGIHMPGFLFD